jgi:hypothetical protein
MLVVGSGLDKGLTMKNVENMHVISKAVMNTSAHDTLD